MNTKKRRKLINQLIFPDAKGKVEAAIKAVEDFISKETNKEIENEVHNREME